MGTYIGPQFLRLYLLFTEKKPEFTEKMRPVTLIENRTGLVICPVAASPPPEITWRKNGRIILKICKADVQNNERFKAAANEKYLLIPNVQLSDAGTYTCRAKNRRGEAQDSSDVTVGSKYFNLMFVVFVGSKYVCCFLLLLLFCCC
jgi:hypothetical protein